MTRIAFRGIPREHLVALAIAILVAAICLLLSGGPAHGADQPTIKAYNPFGEPKPAIPQEMLSDKRLDRKVEVGVKGMNLKALLGELGTLTGVNLSVETKIESERPIIFFKSRSLRDVMTELSGFYGYTWLAKPGGYELIEDAEHVKARSDRMAEGRQRQDALLLDFTKKYLAASPDSENIKKLSMTNNMAYQSLFGPTGKFTAALLSSLGEDILARALTDGGVNMGFSESPAAFQTAYCDWSNAMAEMGRRWRGGDQATPVTPIEPAGMASQKVSIRRAQGGLSSFPRFEFSVTSPSGNTSTLQWPSYQLRYDDLSAVAGWSAEESASTPQLSNEIKISPPIPETRLWLTAADILQAIADQSGEDVIADGVQQDQQGPLIAGVPLGTLVGKLCREQGYAAEVDGSTLRLRLTQWYSQTLPQEPPEALMDACWKDIEKDGKLSMPNLVALASLPVDQMQSPEVRDMPGARDALRSPVAFRLWVSLTDAKVPAGGMPVAGLSAEQTKLFDSWITTGRNAVAPEKVAAAVLTITTERVDGGFRSRGPSEYQQLSLKAGGEVLLANPVYLSPPLSDDERQALIGSRRAEREADVIKLAL
jgi:hypothetical protein